MVNPMGPPNSGNMSNAIDKATASASKFEGIIKSIEKSVDNIVKGLSGVNGVGGASTSMSGGIGGNGKSNYSSDVDGSLRAAQARLDQLLPRTGFEKGLGVAGTVASVAGYAYGMMPNTIDAVSQRITAQGVASMSGMSANQIISSSNALLAGGVTGAQSSTASTAILASRGILPTMGSYQNIMSQTSGFSILTGQSNEQVASGFASMNGMNTARLGVRARNSDGSLRAGADIASDLYRRMYGNRSVTAEQAAQVFNPNSKAYQNVMAAAGGNQELFNSLATNMVFQAQNGGRKLDMSPENVKNNILKLPKDDPMRKMYDYQQSEAKKLEVTGNGLVGGFGAALDTTTAVNNGFSSLAKTLGPVAEGFAKLKGFLDTLPTAGNTGATLFAAGGNLASQVGGNIQSKIAEKITNDILKQLGIGGSLGGAGGATSGLDIPLGNNGPGGGLGGAGKAGGFKGLLKSPTAKGLGLAAVGTVAGMGFDFIKNREAGKHSETTNKVGLIAGRAGEYALKGAGMGMMLGSVVPGLGNAVGAGLGAVLGTAYGAFKGYTESNSATNSNYGGDSGPSSTSPASGPITARYGQKPKNNTYWKWKGYHTGTDWGVRKGTAVKAIQDGVVKEVGADPSNEPYGTKVLIDHGGFQSMYAHLSSYTVRPGQKVKAGDQIALSGQSGSGASMGPHLHFEIRKGKNNPVDPKDYLNGSILGNGGGSGVSGFIEGIKDTVGNAISSVEKFLSGKDGSGTDAPGGLSGSSSGSAAQSQFSVSNTGFTMGGTGGTSSLAHGGDMGPPSMGTASSVGSMGGRGVTINMNVTVSKGNTQDAVRLAREVKNILERDLRVNTIASN
ncbi:Peptidase M23 [uncultured Caudovirales phage]|uniref:Peptidase M23 n=1 Tax=uncultured Caudovirales phage TaxID=2100421 RepID=A0A6J5N269_9CAUD|nr:Peptidase M23 [uncultured Caudovirales phage]